MASLLPTPSARPLGVDSAVANGLESDSSSSSPDQQLDQSDPVAALAAR